MDTFKDIAYKLWCTNDIMSILKVDKDKVVEYNKEPVTWCRHCLSLKIMNYDDKLSKIDCYCGTCSSTDVIEGNIKEFLKSYKLRYNKEYGR